MSPPSASSRGPGSAVAARWVPALLGGLTFTLLADEALPAGSLLGKALGAAILAVAAPGILAGRLGPGDRRWLVLPVLGFAALSLTSMLWTVDPPTTALRARHLGMEAALMVAWCALWTRDRARAVGLGAALATGVLAMGFVAELGQASGARLHAFGVHPNLQARDAALGALAAVLLVPGLPRWGIALVALAGGFALGASFSAGALLAAVAACVVLLSGGPRWRIAVASLLAGVLLGAGALTASASRSPRLRTPMTSVRGSAVEEIGSGRLVLWGHALRVTAAHPWVGAGAGAFPAAMEPIRVEHQLRGGEHTKPRRRAHSSFLEALAETGPLGLLLFCAPLAWAAGAAVRRRDEIAGAFVAFTATSAATESLLEQRGLWLGVALAVLSSRARRPGDARASPRPSPPPTS